MSIHIHPLSAQKANERLTVGSCKLNRQGVDVAETAAMIGTSADGVNDIHLHPAEPVQARIALVARF